MASIKFSQLLCIPALAIFIYLINKSYRKTSETMAKMAVQVFLRHDQKLSMRQMDEYQDDKVRIYSFDWTASLLRKLTDLFQENICVELKDRDGSSEKFDLKRPLSLKEYIMLCRNEASNVDGQIAFGQYPEKFDKPAILSLKDLVRQLVIVGEEETAFYGGYPRGNLVKQQAKVILVDLIGLQFQTDYNSGRLVLIGNNLPSGHFDQLIYENIVGEEKALYEQARSDKTGRYVKVDDTYLDTLAYQKFVANDFLLVCIAVNDFAKEKVNLKFLRYGTGFFAGPYKTVLEEHINKGVALGLRNYLDLKSNQHIKAFEFPFYEEDESIKDICSENNLECVFSRADALKRTYEDMIDATTNCADSHVVTGNEMGYTSVDAAIAQNLKSLAIKFSPVINSKMKGYIVKKDGRIVAESDPVVDNKL